MRSLIALTAAVVTLVSAAAQATPSRAVALGGLGLYVEDDTNVLRYPGLISKYSHFVFIDLGGNSGLQPALTGIQQGGLNGGAFLRLSDAFNVGLIASDFAPGEQRAFLNQVANAEGSPNQAVFQSFAPEAPLRRYDVIFGYAPSKFFGAGLRLAYGSDSDTYVPDENTKTLSDPPGDRLTDRKSQTQFTATAGISGMMGDAGSYDVSIDYGHYGLSYDKNNEFAFLASGNEIGVSARARFIVSRFWDIVPQVSYRGSFFNLAEDGIIPPFGDASNAEFEEFKNPDGSKSGGVRDHYRSNHTVDVGAAAALRASAKANFWVATGVLYNSRYTWMNANKVAPLKEMDNTRALYSIPYLRFGVEGSPLEWLQLRGGVEKYTWRESVTTYVNDKEPKQQSTVRRSGSLDANAQADFATYVGASFLLQGFQVDLLLDQQFFTRGPAFLSGAAGDIAGRASLSYKF